jgi:ATP-dependent RNA helicase DDX49/DBP8
MALPAEDDVVHFNHLGISEWLANICKSLGMKCATAVQKGCIPAILEGRDVIATAHTGSGKTAAFALPILQKLAEQPFGVFALVLTPTRELAFQLADQFRALGAGMELQDAVVIGGLDMHLQAKALAKRPHVVVATPGRLRDLIQSGDGLRECFKRVRFLVLDEADRLLEASFASELMVIAGALPPKRQTLLFSATMTDSMTTMHSMALKDAYCFKAYEGLVTAVTLKEEYIFVPAKVKEVYLYHLLTTLEEAEVQSVIVFVSTCKGCKLLDVMLQELDISCVALHSHKSQGGRLAAMDRFKSGSVPVLLATDVASRGLDIPSVDMVVNFDVPMLAKDYVHRVGRTGRATRPGWALTLVSQYDVELVQKIEALLGHQLVSYALPEKEVLMGITKVYSARRKAVMRVGEEESRAELKGRRSTKRKRGPQSEQ